MRVAPTSVPLPRSGPGAPRDPLTLAFGGHRAPPPPVGSQFPRGRGKRWVRRRPFGSQLVAHPGPIAPRRWRDRDNGVMRLPDGVLGMTSRGSDWAAWVDQLPALVRGLYEEWELR